MRKSQRRGAAAKSRRRVPGEANLERDAAIRRQWLTFVIAGGGFVPGETAAR
jgi:hypothetical protein